MSGCLIVEEGPLKGLVLSLEEGSEWIVGRDNEVANLLVEDPSVSRQHLLIRKVDQRLILENQSTTNPTMLNEKSLAGPTMLNEGDRLKIGDEVLLYTLEIPQVSLLQEEPPLTEESGEVELVETEEEKQEESAEEDDEKEDTILDEGPSEGDKMTEVHFDLLERGRFVLKVVGGPNNGAEFPLQAGSSYVIGTDPAQADVVFHDISVSRQHARLHLSQEGECSIEDMSSRNGTFIDEEKLEEKTVLGPNKLVSLGTSAFIVVDSEGERSTIISPLLPSIAKVLAKEEKAEETEEKEEEKETAKEEGEKKPGFSLVGAFVLVALVSGVFAVAGIGLTTLFQEQEIKKKKYDYDQELQEVLAPFPSVRYSFNEVSGRLLLVGHVLTGVDRSQLLYALQTLPFVKTIDDNIIIDEFVWREINQVLGKNPEWRGIAMVSPAPGRFVLAGYLETRKQGESLNEYIQQNFLYPDLLENRVVVEEDLRSRALILLRNNGLLDVTPNFVDGDMKLIGMMPYNYQPRLEKAISEISALRGVRTVQNLVIEQKPSESVINVSDKYKVSGATNQGGVVRSVVISGKILQVGDTLDGMAIIEMTPTAIYLEKGGMRYRIDYNQ